MLSVSHGRDPSMLVRHLVQDFQADGSHRCKPTNSTVQDVVTAVSVMCSSFAGRQG